MKINKQQRRLLSLAGFRFDKMNSCPYLNQAFWKRGEICIKICASSNISMQGLIDLIIKDSVLRTREVFNKRILDGMAYKHDVSNLFKYRND